jgi:uncharacterized SAM-binding protein YcdF (DUF218 family)
MFLFLSKLLPIFIYPLGLSCLLLIATIVLFWKRPRWAAVTLCAALTILLLSSNGWVARGLVRSLEWQNLPLANIPNADAIVVLGGGIKSATSPRPWVDVSEAGDRILYGARLYKQGKAPFLVLSGGRIDWRGGGPPESGDMAQIAEAMGVPKSAILQDTTSLNTYQNAVNVRKLLDDQGIRRRILLVTSAIHTPRSLLIFQRQGFEVTPAPTDFIVSEQELQELTSSLPSILLNLLPDSNQLDHTTQALKEYVGLVIYRLLGWL